MCIARCFEKFFVGILKKSGSSTSLRSSRTVYLILLLRSAILALIQSMVYLPSFNFKNKSLSAILIYLEISLMLDDLRCSCLSSKIIAIFSLRFSSSRQVWYQSKRSLFISSLKKSLLQFSSSYSCFMYYKVASVSSPLVTFFINVLNQSTGTFSF